MMRRGLEDNEIFGVLGTGRFGLAVAEELLARKKNVIAVDNNPLRLRPLSNTDAEVYVINDISFESLQETGLGECSTVIVGIGKDVENSILAALNLIELGVKHVICKVISEDHAKIVRKIGAEVIFPEIEIGKRTAIKLCEKLAEDVLPLSDEFSIMQMRTPSSLDLQSVREIRLRERYGITLIAVIRNGKAYGSIGPDTVLHTEEIMVLSGSNDDLEKFQKHVNPS